MSGTQLLGLLHKRSGHDERRSHQSLSIWHYIAGYWCTPNRIEIDCSNMKFFLSTISSLNHENTLATHISSGNMPKLFHQPLYISKEHN
jgi:hypothetical protein